METSGRNCRFLRRLLSLIPRSFPFCLGETPSRSLIENPSVRKHSMEIKFVRLGTSDQA